MLNEHYLLYMFQEFLPTYLAILTNYNILAIILQSY